jgi:hypothetical protein
MERSSHIRVMSSRAIVRETRNHMRETSSGVKEKDKDYWAVV